MINTIASGYLEQQLVIQKFQGSWDRIRGMKDDQLMFQIALIDQLGGALITCGIKEPIYLDDAQIFAFIQNNAIPTGHSRYILDRAGYLRKLKPNVVQALQDALPGVTDLTTGKVDPERVRQLRNPFLPKP